MKQLFTGTGRCGTAYLAQLLTENGFPCSHELLFNPFREIQQWEFDTVERESSWCAQFWLRDLPTECTVFHVVRDPRKVYDSFMRRRFFAFEKTQCGPELRWHYQKHMRLVDDSLTTLSEAERCERWIIGTHERLASYTDIRIDCTTSLSDFLSGHGIDSTYLPAPTHTSESTEEFYKPQSIIDLAKELGYE